MGWGVAWGTHQHLPHPEVNILVGNDLKEQRWEANRPFSSPFPLRSRKGPGMLPPNGSTRCAEWETLLRIPALERSGALAVPLGGTTPCKGPQLHCTDGIAALPMDAAQAQRSPRHPLVQCISRMKSNPALLYALLSSVPKEPGACAAQTTAKGSDSAPCLTNNSLNDLKPIHLPPVLHPDLVTKRTFSVLTQPLTGTPGGTSSQQGRPRANPKPDLGLQRALKMQRSSPGVLSSC